MAKKVISEGNYKVKYGSAALGNPGKVEFWENLGDGLRRYLNDEGIRANPIRVKKIKVDFDIVE